MGLVVLIFDYIVRIFSLLIIVYVVLSYFMDPYHPIRRTVSSWVDPFLNPIRRVLPSTGMIDLSPLVLILILQILSMLIRSILL